MYLPSDEQLPEERWHVGGIASGGFFAAKGAVEALYDALKLEPRFERAEEPFLHPGKAARVEAGWVGELHPALGAEGFGAFELDLDTLFAGVPERIAYEDVITYPSLRQDLAVVVGRGRAGGRSGRGGAEPPFPSCARRASSTSTAASRCRRGASRSRSRSRSRRPTARSRTRRPRACASAIVAALGERFGAEIRGT